MKLAAMLIGITSAPLLIAQAPPGPAAPRSTAGLEFEVASIRPAAPMVLPGRGGAGTDGKGGIPGRCVQRLTLDQSRLDIRCYSLGKLMWAWAFGVPPSRLIGPGWMGDSASDWTGGPRFDIMAKLPDGASRNQVPAMLQNLLAARFKLTAHREFSELSVYALVAAKGGLNLQPASPEPASDPSPGEPMNMNGIPFYGSRTLNPGDGLPVLMMNSPQMGTVRDSSSGGPRNSRRFEASSITLEGMADLLTIAGIGPEPVVDLTGDRGRYRMVLEMSMGELEALRSTATADAADLQNAQLKAARDGLKKLGLQLEQRKAPVEVIVIDHLDKSPAGN